MLKKIAENKLQVAIFAVVILLAFLAPYFTGRYLVMVLATAFIWAMAALGLNVIIGLVGQPSIAHGAFFGVSAYMVGIMTTKAGWNVWLALIIAIVFTSFFALLISLPAIRTRLTYFAIFTLCLNLIVTSLIIAWGPITEGSKGMVFIPSFFKELNAQYYLILVVLILCVFIVYRLRNSVIGLSWAAIRLDETLAASLGINIVLNKVIAFVISVAIVALAGGLYAGLITSLTPAITSFYTSFYLLIYLIVGGPGTVLGPVMGAFFLFYLTQALYFFDQYRLIIYSALLLFCIVYMPRGIWGAFKNRFMERFPGLRPW